MLPRASLIGARWTSSSWDKGSGFRMLDRLNPESWTLNPVARTLFAFRRFPAFLIRSYGSSKTQSLEDAAAHAQGIAPLGSSADEQVHAVRQHCRLAYRMPFLRLLQRPSGAHRRRRVMWEGPQRPACAGILPALRCILRRSSGRCATLRSVRQDAEHRGWKPALPFPRTPFSSFALHSTAEIRKLPLR